jgi:transcriptional regulator with XRE-family HTH domain
MRMKSSQLNAPVTPSQAQRLGRAIDRWRRAQGLTQTQLLRTAQVSQGQLSRILSGRFSRASAAVLRLCRAAGADVEQHAPDPSRRGDWGTVLERAVHRSWDGTPGHARELLRLLRVAKALRSP